MTENRRRRKKDTKPDVDPLIRIEDALHHYKVFLWKKYILIMIFKSKKKKTKQKKQVLVLM